MGHVNGLNYSFSLKERKKMSETPPESYEHQEEKCKLSRKYLGYLHNKYPKFKDESDKEWVDRIFPLYQREKQKEYQKEQKKKRKLSQPRNYNIMNPRSRKYAAVKKIYDDLVSGNQEKGILNDHLESVQRYFFGIDYWIIKSDSDPTILNEKNAMKKEHGKILEPREYLKGDAYYWFPRFINETEEEHERRILGRPRDEKDSRKTPIDFHNEQKDVNVREFETGATRDSEDGKLDYEGFLSTLALQRYAEYMHKHRKQSDGEIRCSDNWQKGIPLDAYIKSLWRHLIEVWTIHRKLAFSPYSGTSTTNPMEEIQEEALCAIIFNAFGYLHEVKKAQEEKSESN